MLRQGWRHHIQAQRPGGAGVAGASPGRVAQLRPFEVAARDDCLQQVRAQEPLHALLLEVPLLLRLGSACVPALPLVWRRADEAQALCRARSVARPLSHTYLVSVGFRDLAIREKSPAPSTPHRCKRVVYTSRRFDVVGFAGAWQSLGHCISRRGARPTWACNQLARNLDFEARSRPHQLGAFNIDFLAELRATSTIGVVRALSTHFGADSRSTAVAHWGQRRNDGSCRSGPSNSEASDLLGG